MERLTFVVLIPIDENVPKRYFHRCLDSITTAIKYCLSNFPDTRFVISYGCPRSYDKELDIYFHLSNVSEEILHLSGWNMPDRVNHIRQAMKFHSSPYTFYTFIDADDSIAVDYFHDVVGAMVGLLIAKCPTLVDVHPFRRRGNMIYQKSYLDNFSLITYGEEILDYPGPGMTLWGRFFRFSNTPEFLDDLYRIKGPTHGWGEEQALLQLLLQHTIRNSRYLPDIKYYWHYPDIEGEEYTPLSRQLNIHDAINNIEIAQNVCERPKLFTLMMVDRLFKSLNLKYKDPEDLDKFQRDLYYVSRYFELDEDEIVFPDEQWMNDYDRYSVEVIVGARPLTNEGRLPFLDKDITLIGTKSV